MLFRYARSRKAVIVVLGGLIALEGTAAAWQWLDNKRLTNYITRSLVKPELEEALRSIWKVLTTFERDIRSDVKWNWTSDHVPALVNLLMLNTIHERAVARRTPPTRGLNSMITPADEAVGKHAARYVRFSSSAYGILLMKGTNVMHPDAGWPPLHTRSVPQLDKWCIVKHCDIDESDLVKVALENKKLHLPAYFIAVDHASKSVVLSVRGTFSMQNTVTDLVCESVDFMGGLCHRGLRQGAESLLEETKDDLLKELKKNKGYKLVLCGHSLGGGVSILLAMMMLKHRRELGLRRTDLQCYAFAPPPVFGPEEAVPKDVDGVIKSFVFGNDLVCRLSLASAYGLFRDLKEVEAAKIPLTQRLKYLAREHLPHVSVEDDGMGVPSMRVAYRYASIIRQATSSRSVYGESSRSRGVSGRNVSDEEDCLHPAQAFVRDKMERDFDVNGYTRADRVDRQARAVAVARGVYNKYERLIIPGTIYHLRKASLLRDDLLGGQGRVGSDSGIPRGEVLDPEKPIFWMERASAEEFARLLLVDTAILDHFPKAYEGAIHAIYGDGLREGNKVAEGDDS